MHIETERLILRPLREDDRLPYLDMSNDPEATRFFAGRITNERVNARFDELRQRFAQDGTHFLAAESRANGEFVGIIGIARISDKVRALLRGTPELEVGWAVRRTFWGQGLAPEGAAASLDYAWRVLHANEVVAMTRQDNMPSRRVMEKIGMIRDDLGDFDMPVADPAGMTEPYVLYRIDRPSPLPNG